MKYRFEAGRLCLQVLLAQHVFPGTLVPAALLGIVECIALLLFSPVLGRMIDHDESRLRPVVLSIVVNRAALMLICLCWLAIIYLDILWLSKCLFAFILCLTGVEIISRVGNTLSFERDWVPALADESHKRTDSVQARYSLTHLNTAVWRINITGKLGAPIAASAALTVMSFSALVLSLGSFSVLAAGVEIFALRTVWSRIGRTRLAKSSGTTRNARRTAISMDSAVRTDLTQRLLHKAASLLRSYNASLRYYFASNSFELSFSSAILHTTVLVWGGTLITWLLNGGFSYTQLTVARSICAVFEFGSTLIYPLAISYYRRWFRTRLDDGLAPLQSQTDNSSPAVADELEHLTSSGSEDTEPNDAAALNDASGARPKQGPATIAAVIHTSTTSSIALLATTIPTVILLFFMDNMLQKPTESSPRSNTEGIRLDSVPILAILFIAALASSLLARLVFDIAVRQALLDAIPPNKRSEFGSVETAVGSSFSLVHLIAAAIWNSQSDFKWLASAGLASVIVSTALSVKWKSAARYKSDFGI